MLTELNKQSGGVVTP
jgi:hypothetical protein